MAFTSGLVSAATSLIARCKPRLPQTWRGRKLLASVETRGSVKFYLSGGSNNSRLQYTPPETFPILLSSLIFVYSSAGIRLVYFLIFLYDDDDNDDDDDDDFSATISISDTNWLEKNEKIRLH